MTSMRRTVKLPGDNSMTVGQLRAALADNEIPDRAKVRTFHAVREPDIHLWWDEELPAEETA